MPLPIVITGVSCHPLPTDPDVFFSLPALWCRGYESALPSTALPLHPSQHAPRTRRAVSLTGGQEAFANAPFNAHFSKSNGGVEGKKQELQELLISFPVVS